MKPSEILAKAADLIAPEGAWTQGSYALSANGDTAPPEDPEAVCWCASGAILRVAPSEDAARVARRIVMETNQLFSLGQWNDRPSRTQAEVVAALRKASDLAREAERVPA